MNGPYELDVYAISEIALILRAQFAHLGLGDFTVGGDHEVRVAYITRVSRVSSESLSNEVVQRWNNVGLLHDDGHIDIDVLIVRLDVPVFCPIERVTPTDFSRACICLDGDLEVRLARFRDRATPSFVRVG